jgi:hypothetical protein
MDYTLVPREHKSWEDWLVLALGGALLLSPVMDDASLPPLVIANVVVVGFAVMVAAVSELMLAQRWDARLTLVLGVWMMAAPYVIGYGGNLGVTHGVIGALIAVLAAVELWQDFSHTDSDPAHE